MISIFNCACRTGLRPSLSSISTLGRRTSRWTIGILIFIGASLIASVSISAEELTRLKYNNPGLTVDLGVGLWAWPLPMDYDNDGDLDLVVVCPDKPYSGTYLFENDGQVDPRNSAMPIFKPARRIANAQRNPQLSIIDEEPLVLTPSRLFTDFRNSHWADSKQLPIETKLIHQSSRIRANQWKLVDWNNDGALDLLVGIGDWEKYGWDDAFDAEGNWTRGPLEGFVYLLLNQGTNDEPNYAEAQKLQTTEGEINVYGMPSPCPADFDGDGDLDLICGEFLDGFTYFENKGTSDKPELAMGRRLRSQDAVIAMDLQMITPVECDWNLDGRIDLICGDEDGRVAWLENLGIDEEGQLRFAEPIYFQQVADELKFGALVTPVSVDWDSDGDEDLICGNTAGYIGYFENLDGGNPPRWAAPVRLQADGQTIRIHAGPNGSIQGPCEAKWGYTTVSVADWDGDGKQDILLNSIWGSIDWYRNIGTPTEPRLTQAGPVKLAGKSSPPKPAWNWWDPQDDQLVTQWRTTPVAYDWNGDGAMDLVMLDHEGYLCLFERNSMEPNAPVQPGRRLFRTAGASGFDSSHRPKDESPGLLRLNVNRAGASGRRKLAITDWNGDGLPDVIVNSVNANLLLQVAAPSDAADDDEAIWFADKGKMADRVLAGHTTSPTTVDWNRDGKPELLIGAEDGFLYYLPR